MRAFTCPACSAIVFFENSVCLTCGTPIGFDRELRGFRALRSVGGRLIALRR